MHRFFRHGFVRRKWFGRGLLLGCAPLAAAGCHGSHHSHHHEDLSEEEMQAEIHRGVEFVLDRVDATDAQVDTVTRVLQDAIPDMRAFREERKALTTEMQIALRKQSIDRDELESLRTRALDLADRASARAVTVIADAAEELHPEQRSKLVAFWKRRTGA